MPLSVNSTTTERMHYVDHVVHAPAMTLEHLVDQYWFPTLGLLISRARPRLAPFVSRAVPGGFSYAVKAIVDRPLPNGTHEHLFFRSG